MTHRAVSIAFSAILSVASSGSAHSKSSAKATLQDIAITLIDLRPDDGTVPAFAFDTGEAYGPVAVTGFARPASAHAAPFSALAVSAMTSTSPIRGSVSGDATVGNAIGAVSAWAASSNGIAPVDFAGASFPNTGLFSLSPWTGIRIDAMGAASALTTVGSNGTSDELAHAQPGLKRLIFRDDGAPEEHRSIREVYASVDAGWDPVRSQAFYSGQTRSDAGILGLTFANMSDSEVAGLFEALAMVDGRSPFPIPEPSTYGLMASGLMVVLAVARGRRESASK